MEETRDDRQALCVPAALARREQFFKISRGVPRLSFEVGVLTYVVREARTLRKAGSWRSETCCAASFPGVNSAAIFAIDAFFLPP